MKAKLIKSTVQYRLLNEDGIVIATSFYNGKLSLKNCQAIERGYDLDEIKRKVFDGFDGQPNSFTIVAVEQTIQIMVELMGDKKFSYEDMEKVFVLGVNSKTELHARDKAIQSLQQTEWDVEICCEMDCQGDWDKCKNTSFECELCTNTGVPILDADGCLILKRI